VKGEGWAFIFWVALILAVPSVQADHLDDVFGEGGEGQTIRYQIRDITNSTLGGFTSDLTFFRLHTFDLAPGGTIVRANVQATFAMNPTNDGEFLYQLIVDGQDVEDCHFILPVVAPGGFLQGDLVVYPSYDVECTISPALTASWDNEEVISVEWERTIISGSPDDPVASTVSIVFDREDFILTPTPNGSGTAFESLTGVTGLEFTLFVLVIGLGVVLWSRSKDPIVQLFSSLLVILFGSIGVSLYAEWVGWIPMGSAMIILGGYMILRSTLDTLTEG